MAITTVRVQINGIFTNLTKNSSTGKWEGNLTAPGVTSFNLPGGYYPVLIEATNSAGTTATASPDHLESLKLVVREKVKPTISITSPGSGAYVTNAQQAIVFRLRDETGGSGINISSLRLQIDSGGTVNNTSSGMSITPVTGGFDVTYTPNTALSDGEHTVKINISDNDGNASVQASRTYTVDTVPPILNITNPTDGFITNTANLIVAGTTNDMTSSPVTLSLTLNGLDQGAITIDVSGNFSKSLTLAEGENILSIKAVDRAGKTSTATLRGTLDISVPVITAVTISPNPADAGVSLVISAVIT